MSQFHDTILTPDPQEPVRVGWFGRKVRVSVGLSYRPDGEPVLLRLDKRPPVRPTIHQMIRLEFVGGIGAVSDAAKRRLADARAALRRELERSRFILTSAADDLMRRSEQHSNPTVRCRLWDQAEKKLRTVGRIDAALASLGDYRPPRPRPALRQITD